MSFAEEEKGVLLCVRRRKAVLDIRSSMNTLPARGFYDR